jgi:S-formylglutathione hydrolase FrmB
MAMVYTPWEWVNPPRNPQPGVLHRTYFSASMQHDVGYNIYLPPGYAASQQRYPVVYRLHGLNNCESTDYFPARYLDEGIRAGELPPMILVYPNGWWCSFYADSPDGQVMAETTIIEELIPTVDAMYRTVGTRGARAIQGMSMGGFGALKLAFKHVDLFSSVVAFAAGLLDGPTLLANHPQLMQTMFAADAQRFDAEAPAAWVRRNADVVRETLPIWMICGSDDLLLAGNLAMHALLDELHIAHELELIPGIAHNLPALAESVQRRGFAFAARSFRLP